jgi:hypothetical protein
MCDWALQFCSLVRPKYQKRIGLKNGGKGIFGGNQYIFKVVRCLNIDCKNAI